MQGLIFYPGHQDLHLTMTICDNNEPGPLFHLMLRMLYYVCACDNERLKQQQESGIMFGKNRRKMMCVCICHARGFKTGFFSFSLILLCAAITFNSASQSVTSATSVKLKHLRELPDLFLLQLRILQQKKDEREDNGDV